MNIFKRIFNQNKIDSKLIGQWEDEVEGEKVIINFSSDGNLDYKIHNGGKVQIIEMTFKTRNGLIVTDQPSSPKEEVTKYKIQGGVLELDYNGELTRFIKK